MLDVDTLIDGVDADADPVLTLTVQNAVPAEEEPKRLRPKKKLIREWANAALMRDANVTLRWVGEAEGRKLNADFRDKDYATNVLTFVYDESDGALTGDLVICLPVVVAEAEAQGKSLTAHLAHLVVHGMLHLQGMDHEDATDAEAMEAMEREILGGLGFPDPYAE
jgi:probable rRNA maturation factor